MSPQQKIDYLESQLASWVRYPGPARTADDVRNSQDYKDRNAELIALYREADAWRESHGLGKEK